jgi:hypothetical protein
MNGMLTLAELFRLRLGLVNGEAQQAGVLGQLTICGPLVWAALDRASAGADSR